MAPADGRGERNVLVDAGHEETEPRPGMSPGGAGSAGIARYGTWFCGPVLARLPLPLSVSTWYSQEPQIAQSGLPV